MNLKIQCTVDKRFFCMNPIAVNYFTIYVNIQNEISIPNIFLMITETKSIFLCID